VGDDWSGSAVFGAHAFNFDAQGAFQLEQLGALFFDE
jgi:hypothetical protein